VQVANQSKILTTFDYDFRGLRVGKDITGKPKKIGGFKTRTMLFHYDRQGHFIAENNKAESTLTEYVWLDDMPVAMARNGTLYFVHADLLGTPQKVTDASQSLVWDAVLRPFGRIEQESFSFTQLLRFPGQYHDTEDKLFYNMFRDYDPDLGRYVESDPMGLRGGINSYAYASENPLSLVDPSGLYVTFSGTPDQLSSLIAAYNRVKSTHRGGWMCKKLENSPQTYIINGQPPKNLPKSFYDPNAHTIYVDPDFHPIVPTTDGPQPAPTDAQLGHEIGHAATGASDDGPGPGNNTNLNENPIRLDLGEPARTGY
jgi:RHS repeat-associated protein